MQQNFIKIIFIATLLAGAIFAPAVFASVTDGTIDATYKYAWSENAGWLNFGTSGGNVHITDSGLTGYAWSENYGWINLSPATSGVANNGSGVLSGSAWSEGLGWINFSGVTINSSGEFLGYGTVSRDDSQISFNCINTNSCSVSDFKVKTDWRPRNSRLACNNATDDDGDGKIDYPNDPGCGSLTDADENDPGGGMPAAAFNPPAPPPILGFNVLISNGDEYSENSTINLALSGGTDSVRMAISNFSDFQNTGQEVYAPTKVWDLCQGLAECPEGQYTVYVKFYTSWGQSSGVVSDNIIYRKKTISEKIIELTPAKIIESIPEILQPLIPGFFKPKPPETPPEISLEKLLPKKAPLTLRGNWQLLPTNSVKEFVLAPLPKEMAILAQKFPELGETLKKVGITKMTDLNKLKAVQLILPGITKELSLLTSGIQSDKLSRPRDLPIAGVQPAKFALPEGIPIAKLSMAAKQKVPTEIVFAKAGGGLVDYNITLTVNNEGRPEQTITTITAKPLQLIVKPDKPVKSIKGYIVFRSKPTVNNQSRINIQDLTASLFFAKPTLAVAQKQSVIVEEKLVLLEFEYTDFDGDGIYAADVQMPAVEGEYEVITVLEFQDENLGQKEIRLITVVDPEGYVYEKNDGKETRIPGAIVSLFWLSPATKQYGLWPAKEYQQENPQTTDNRGTYSFLVPEGFYYLKVEAPGYPVYNGKSFQVREGSGIHVNIELKTKYWWLNIVDWKTVLLILGVALLLYNFYRDKIREESLQKKITGS